MFLSYLNYTAMSQAMAESIQHHDNDAQVKRIWKVFWLLLIVTIVELGLGLTLYFLDLPEDLRKHLIKGVIIILSLAKAYYIVSVFMHLGDEIRNLIMTIIVPLMLFIWFILAFLWDGNAWKNLKNTDAGSRTYKEAPNRLPAQEQGKKD
jgi:cytochrome c oxidase subunit IV